MENLDTNPDLKLAEEYFNIGKELLEKKDFKGAVMNLEIALTYIPNKTDYLNFLGRAYSGAGERKIAYEKYKLSAELGDGRAAAVLFFLNSRRKK